MSLKKHHIRKNLAYIHFYFHTINSAGESLSDIRLIFPTPLEVSHLITFFVGGLIHQFFFVRFFPCSYAVIITSAITRSGPASYRGKLISNRTSLLLLRKDIQLRATLLITNCGRHSDSQMCRHALWAPSAALPTGPREAGLQEEEPLGPLPTTGWPLLPAQRQLSTPLLIASNESCRGTVGHPQTN